MKKNKRIALTALAAISVVASMSAGGASSPSPVSPKFADGDGDSVSESESSVSESSSEESSENSVSSGEGSSSEISSSESSVSSSSSEVSSSETTSSSETSSSENSSSSETEEEIMIGSVDDWNNFADLCNREAGYSVNKTVYLRSDIDFKDKAFIPISTFRGTFDGNFHALLNIRITGEKEYPSIFHILAKDGIIKRLDVLNVDIDCGDEDYVGVVSKNYGNIYDLKVTGSIRGQNYVGAVGLNGLKANMSDDSDANVKAEQVDAKLIRIDNEADVSGLSNVGGVVGENFGQVKDSKNKGTVSAEAKNANSIALNIGGIAGYSLGKLDGNENDGEVTNGSVQALQVGGIVGKGNGELYFERNYGKVTGTKYVGGICGYYGNMKKNTADLQEYFGESSWNKFVEDNKDWLKNLGFDVDTDINEDDFEEKADTVAFDYSYSEGDVNGDSDVGGIVGMSTSSDVVIREAVSKSDVDLRVGTFGGGVAGNMQGGTISYSVASGHIKGTVDVGGIAGHGVNFKDNLSSALVEGSDRVGGVAGSIAGNFTSNLSNALVVNANDKTSAGSLVGVVENFNEVSDAFESKVQYNYYISELGGISRRQYGQEFNDAAKRLTVEEITTDDGTISSSFGEGFDKDGYLPGKDEDYFPTPKYLSQADVDKSYGSEDDFTSQYNTYSAIYKSAAKYDSKVTCLLTFMEWREEDGDLYDDYGNVDKTHYEITSYQKVPIHEKLEDVPDFKYAKKQGDLTIYSGDKNTYIVSWDLPKGEIEQSMIVYASYSERVKTLTAGNNEYVVEGAFEKGTTMEIVENSSVQKSTIYCVKFYDKDGNELTMKNVTLKINMKKHPGKVVYYVDGALTNRISGATDSSSYFVFRYSTGQYFTFLDETDVKESLPEWVTPTVSGVCGGLVVALILGIGISIGHRKSAREADKGRSKYFDEHGKEKSEEDGEEPSAPEKKEEPVPEESPEDSKKRSKKSK